MRGRNAGKRRESITEIGRRKDKIRPRLSCWLRLPRGTAYGSSPLILIGRHPRDLTIESFGDWLLGTRQDATALGVYNDHRWHSFVSSTMRTLASQEQAMVPLAAGWHVGETFLPLTESLREVSHVPWRPTHKEGTLTTPISVTSPCDLNA